MGRVDSRTADERFHRFPLRVGTIAINQTKEKNKMKTINFTWWKSDQFYLGYLNDYPDYMTQGETKEELQENLQDLLKDIESGEIPYIRKTESMLVA